jgi:hypothetical protein
MQAKVYNKLRSLFPQANCDASSLPEKMKIGKVLTYTATITKEQVHAIAVYCTGEDPSTLEDTYHYWKAVKRRDEVGQIIKEENEEGKKVALVDWQPIRFYNNRKPGVSHIKTLSNRFSRTGYQPSLRKIVFGKNGELLDGQHSLLALWYMFNDPNCSHDSVNICIEINNKNDPAELFPLFDQAQRRRSLKDALTTVEGIPEGFETELAGVLRFCTLIASGKGINSSRLELEHIVDENSLDKEGNPKPVKLEADDVANLINPGECFEYVSYDVHALLDATYRDPETKETFPLLMHPNLTGQGKANAQYWITAYLDAQYSASGSVNIVQFTDFLMEIVKAGSGESKNQAAIMMASKTVAKATEWLAAIEQHLLGYLTKKKPSTSKKLPYNGIETNYGEWLSMQEPQDVPEYEEEYEDDEDTEEYEEE